jgi:hypothetical protein
MEKQVLGAGSTVFICVAKKYGKVCPKRVDPYELAKNCFSELANPPGKSDFEVYRQ